MATFGIHIGGGGILSANYIFCVAVWKTNKNSQKGPLEQQPICEIKLNKWCLETTDPIAVEFVNPSGITAVKTNS